MDKVLYIALTKHNDNMRLITGFYEKDNIEYLNHYKPEKLEYENFLNEVNLLIKDYDIKKIYVENIFLFLFEFETIFNDLKKRGLVININNN